METKNEPFDDIIDAIHRLRVAFMRHGMEPPKSVELGNIKDGDWFRYSMPRDLVRADPRMGETRADAEWVCNILGVEVRMPAQWRTDLDGRTRLYTPTHFQELPKPGKD